MRKSLIIFAIAILLVVGGNKIVAEYNLSIDTLNQGRDEIKSELLQIEQHAIESDITEILADNSYVDTEIVSILNGTPEAFESLSTIQTAYPKGSNYVKLNLADGYVYKWNGTDWVQGWVYQGTVIANKSVGYNRIDDDLAELITEGISSRTEEIVFNDWVRKTISTTGSTGNSSTRISNSVAHQYPYETVTFKINAGYGFRIFAFGSDVISNENFIKLLFNRRTEYTLSPEDDTYYAILISKDDDSSIITTDAVNLVLTGNTIIKANKYSEKGGSIINGLPEYFAIEAEDTINKVNNYTQQPCFSTIVLTDTHCSPSYSIEETANNIKYVNEKVKIDALSHLGDLVNGNLIKPTTLDLIKKSVYELKKAGRLYITPGNHDFNTFLSEYTGADVVNNGDWYSSTQRFTDDTTVRNSNKPYFYVEYPKVKIRTIYMNAYHYNDSTGKILASWSSELLNWLETDALVTQDGWGIVIFSHTPFVGQINYGNITPGNSNLMQNLMLGYNDTKKGKEIIAWFYGHTHADAVFRIDGIPFPFIMTANSYPEKSDLSYTYTGADNVQQSSTISNRVKGTASQDLWDVAIIRRDLRKIYCVRFGAGNDREISY